MLDKEAFDMQERNQNDERLEREKWGVKREGKGKGFAVTFHASRITFHVLRPPIFFALPY